MGFSKVIFSSYLFSMGVVHAFSISERVNIPILLSCLLLILVPFGPLRKNPTILKDYIVIFITFSLPPFFGMVSGLDYFSDKTINHLLSYLVVPFLFYFLPRYYLERYQKRDFIVPCLTWGWLVFCVFTILEFFLVNIFNLPLEWVVPRPSVEEYSPTIFGTLIRARSFTEESAHSALYVGIIFFIMSYFQRTKSLYRILFILSLGLMFGTTSIIALLGALFISTVLVRDKQDNLKSISVFLLLLSIFVWGLGQLDFDLIDSMVSKFESESLTGRLDFIGFSWNLFIKRGMASWFFGLGPGYYSGAGIDAVVSLPFLTLFQSGVLGLAGLLFLFRRYFLRARQIHFGLLAAVLYGAICYVSISNYWYPWMWFLFALIDVEGRGIGVKKNVKYNARDPLYAMNRQPVLGHEL